MLKHTLYWTSLYWQRVCGKKKNKQKKRIIQISPACTRAAGSIEAAGLWSSQRFLSGSCGEHTALPRVGHVHTNTLYRTHQRNKYKHDAAEHAWNTLVYPIFYFFSFSPPLIFKSITHYSSSWRSGVAGPRIHHSSADARVFSPASKTTSATISTERRDALPRSTEDIYFKFSSRLPKLFFRKIPETVCQDEARGNVCKVMRRTNISPSPFNRMESQVLKIWRAERVMLSHMERL